MESTATRKREILSPGEGSDSRRRALDFMAWRVVPGALVLAAALYPLADPDMWWHLAAGRLVLEGNFPVTNTFSYLFPDRPWHFTQWLFGTLIALAESVGGFVFVQVAVFAFAAAAFLLVVATIRRDTPGASWSLALPLVAIGVLSARFRFVPRGDLATLLGLALVQYLWVLRPRRLPLILLVTACAWSNLHAGVVFGILEIGIFGLAAVLDRDRGSIREALTCGVAFFAGSLANPFFHYPYAYIVENIEVARRFPLPILELQPPDPTSPRFAVLAALIVLGLLPAILRRRYRDILLIAGSGAMAFGAVRFVAFPAVLALPGVVKSFHDYRDFLAGRLNPKATAALLSGLGLAGALVLGSVEWRRVPPGLGADVRHYPAGAADLVLSRGLSGRMFNEFAQGGFLAWRLFPTQRVFIDGRGNAYPWDHFREAAGYSRGTVARLVDAHGIDVAVVERRPYEPNADLGPAFASLGWDLVHVEGASLLFVRPGSPDAVRARGEVFRSFLPWENAETLFRSARANPEAMHAELLRVDPGSLVAAHDFNVLGLCAFYTGDVPLAAGVLSAGLSLNPADCPLRLAYGVVLAVSGRAGEAAAQLRRVIDLAPATAYADEARRMLEVVGAAAPRNGGTAR